MVNLWLVEFVRQKLKLYLYFISSLNTDMARVVETFVVGINLIEAELRIHALAITGSDNGLSPGHYLNQSRHVFDWTIENRFQWNLNENKTIFIQEIEFENVVCQMLAILLLPQCVIIYSKYMVAHILVWQKKQRHQYWPRSLKIMPTQRWKGSLNQAEWRIYASVNHHWLR